MIDLHRHLEQIEIFSSHSLIRIKNHIIMSRQKYRSKMNKKMTNRLAKIGNYHVQPDVKMFAKSGYICIHVKITAIRLREKGNHPQRTVYWQ